MSYWPKITNLNVSWQLKIWVLLRKIILSSYIQQNTLIEKRTYVSYELRNNLFEMFCWSKVEDETLKNHGREKVQDTQEFLQMRKSSSLLSKSSESLLQLVSLREKILQLWIELSHLKKVSCGFCSNRILHYFPMLVCVSVSHLKFSR